MPLFPDLELWLHVCMAQFPVDTKSRKILHH